VVFIGLGPSTTIVVEACLLGFVGWVERGQRNVSILNLRTLAKVLRLLVADLPKDLA
jgi:hypothetical protein